MSTREALRIVADGLRADAGGTAGAARRRGFKDWIGAITLANEHLVAPALYVSLGNADGLSELPADARDYLEMLYRANLARNLALRQQADTLVATLNRAGIAPMLLKGALALFLDHYADPGARMIGDLDLLVRREDLEKAEEALEQLGYHIETLYLPLRHAYAEFTQPGLPGAVDLHVELVDANQLLPAANVWRRARQLSQNGMAFIVPSLEDALLHNVWHDQLHYLGEFYHGRLNLRQLYDFVRLASAGGATIDWTRLADTVAALRLVTPFHAYLLAAEDLLGFAWPLPRTPIATARLHYLRARLQLTQPVIGRVWLPWANLRAAFAPHRMVSLYGEGDPIMALRLRHAMQFLVKKERPTFVGRLFR